MNPVKIALTGRLRVGKDYVASACSGYILSFADPLYRMCEYLTGLGPANKDAVPFVRKFYQVVGQWGRGEVNDQYPYSMDRAIFTGLVKSGIFNGVCPDVNWDEWGTDMIWTNALRHRANDLTSRAFATNVRFKNELDTLTSEGWDHWHVLCSRQTYEERLREVGMTINDPKISDVSEQLAALMDNSVVNTLKTQPTGPKLKVIWNDHRTSPSERLLSIEEFKQYIENNECTPEYNVTPESESPGEDQTGPAPDAGDGDGPVGELPASAAAERSGDRDPAERRRKRTAKKRAE